MGPIVTNSNGTYITTIMPLRLTDQCALDANGNLKDDLEDEEHDSTTNEAISKVHFFAYIF